ncbi:MAG: N-acetylmuramoyl-L-alanine amidase [PVC group bacterium]
MRFRVSDKEKKYSRRMLVPVAFCLLAIFPAPGSRAFAITVRGPVARIPAASIRHRGTLYLPVAAIARAYGLALAEQDETTFVFSSDDVRLELRPGSRTVIINGEAVEMDSPVDWAEGKLIAPIYLAIVTLPARFPPREPAPLLPPAKRVRIMLDPGHGGIDPGAIGEEGLREKDVVLEIAKEVRALLQARGYEVFLTRSGDRFLSLKKRARQANRCRADLFVSIHANAAFNRLARGTETFYYAPASDQLARKAAVLENAVLRLEAAAGNPENRSDTTAAGGGRGGDRLSESIRAARSVQKRISSVTEGEDRGIKAAEFYVLKFTRMPSILVETGFLSNNRERDQLADAAYRTEMAEAIVRGIGDFCGNAAAAAGRKNAGGGSDPANFSSVPAATAYNMNTRQTGTGEKAPAKEE